MLLLLLPVPELLLELFVSLLVFDDCLFWKMLEKCLKICCV